MSYDLKSVKARQEAGEFNENGRYQTTYSDCEIALTIFSGGRDRGLMLQVTIPQDHEKEFAHVQLTREQALDLITELEIFIK